MVSKNNVTEFIFTGLFEDPEVQRVCFVVFIPVYLATVVGNGLIVLTVKASKSLHSPMYFFLSYLSLVEISYSSTIVPKFLTDLLTKIKTISLEGCLAQIFFFHFFGVTEILLLVVMAYDRSVAICKPLHYINIMNRQLCHVLVACSWLGGFFHSVIQILITIQLHFCGPNVIDHYFCDRSVRGRFQFHRHCIWPRRHRPGCKASPAIHLGETGCRAHCRLTLTELSAPCRAVDGPTGDNTPALAPGTQ